MHLKSLTALCTAGILAATAATAAEPPAAAPAAKPAPPPAKPAAQPAKPAPAPATKPAAALPAKGGPAPARGPEPAPTKPWGKLVVENGKSYELLKPEIIVGNDVSCDIVLTDPSIAPRHFAIRFSGGNASVEDLGSKTGTLVAGTEVKRGKPFKVLNAVEIDPGAVTMKFTFLERGTILPSMPYKPRKPDAIVKTPKPVK